MKKLITILGFIISIFLVIGILFKLQHYPGAGLLLNLSFILISIIFVPLFFINRIRMNKKKLNVFTSIFGMISVSFIFLGVLFKVQHYPGAGMLLVFGSMILIFPTLILYTIQQFVENNRKFNEFWKVVFGIAFFAVFFTLYGLNYAYSFLNTITIIDTQIIDNNEGYMSTNQKLLDYIKLEQSTEKDAINYFSHAENICNIHREMYDYLEEIKTLVIEESDGKNAYGIKNHFNIMSKDNYDIPTYILGRYESTKGKELINKLTESNNKIKESLTEIGFNDNEITKCLIKIPLDDYDNDINFHGTKYPLHVKIFHNVPLVGTLAILANMQNSVLKSQFTVLTLIYDKQKGI